jgi:hypothetical protein
MTYGETAGTQQSFWRFNTSDLCNFIPPILISVSNPFRNSTYIMIIFSSKVSKKRPIEVIGTIRSQPKVEV